MQGAVFTCTHSLWSTTRWGIVDVQLSQCSWLSRAS